MRTPSMRATAILGASVLVAGLATTAVVPSSTAAPTVPPSPFISSQAVVTPDQRTDAEPAPPKQAPEAEHLIVVWKSGSRPAARASALERARTAGSRTLGDPRYQLVEPRDGQTLADARAALRKDPRVELVEANGFSTPAAAPNDPYFPMQWGLRNTGQGVRGKPGTPGADADVLDAWDRTVGTPTTVIAVIDSGYDFNGPELGPVAFVNPLSPSDKGVDFVGDDADNPPLLLPADYNATDTDLLSGGHGLHVAGIIGAQGNNNAGLSGVAQDARILPLRACAHSADLSTPEQPTSICPDASVVAAIHYAGNAGARIANLSLSGTNDVYTQAMADHPNTLFVVAAGNGAEDNDATPHYPCNNVPEVGAVDNVLCVAASDQQDNRAAFSNWGPTSVDLAAPGTELVSTYRATMAPISDTFQEFDFNGKWLANGFLRAGPGADSPLSSYGMASGFGDPTGASEHTAAWRTPVAVPTSAGRCHVEGKRHLVNAAYPASSYSVVVDGDVANAVTFQPTTNNAPGSGMASFVSGEFEATGDTVQLRFLHTPTPSSQVWLDDLAVVCVAPATWAAGYAWLQGTSMAAAHVSGAASLLFSLKPDATVTDVRRTLLDTADRLPQWQGLSVTSGRLDVAAALGRLVPPDTLFTAVPGPTTPNKVSFSFTRESAAAASFRCSLDGKAYAACNATQKLKKLPVGTHTFSVFAVDLYGNVDATPATYTWQVVRCVVPKVKKRTLAEATQRLYASGCFVGKVTKPKGVKVTKLKVKKSIPSKGTKRKSGYKVDLVMVKKKKRR